MGFLRPHPARRRREFDPRRAGLSNHRRGAARFIPDMKKDADRTRTRSRSRKKAAPAPPPAEPAAGNDGGDSSRVNVGPLEGSLSVTVGILFLVGALFPRSIKQLVLLGLGSALVYRGTTRQCNVYSALGIDTAKQPLLKQVNEKFLAPASSEAVDS